MLKLFLIFHGDVQSMKKERVTLNDVAKIAGVSRATASLVIRNSDKISAKTREKVLEAISESGYIYDRIAASMRSNKSTTMGVIITDIANPFYADFLNGVGEILDEAAFSFFLGTTDDNEKKQLELIQRMQEHRIGGLILCPVSELSDKTKNMLLKLDIPIVHAVREIKSSELDYAGIDYFQGIHLAVEHCIAQGHKKIAFFGGRESSSAWQDRKLGFLSTMSANGLLAAEGSIIQTDISTEAARQTFVQLHKENKLDFTAYICFNDFVARGVMLGSMDIGLRPGVDISVVGFDNSVESALYNPSLTSVSSFPNKIGSEVAKLLINRIKHPDVAKKRVILEPELVVRQSSQYKQI